MKSKIILICILLIIAVLKFCFFTNVIIPSFDSYNLLLMAKALWESHSPLIEVETGNYFIFYEPGYSFLIALFYPFFHDFELSARFVTVMASVFSILLIYLFMEKIKKGTGKFAAFILATSTLHLKLSSLILRDIVRFCLICFIFYYFYLRKPFPLYKTILLGLLLACTSLVHLSSIFLLFPFLYLVLKEKKIHGAFFLLGSYAVVLGPYMYVRIFRWPWSSLDVFDVICKSVYSKLHIYQAIFVFLKMVFLKYIHFEPLILILGLAGLISLILKKDKINPQLINKFWGIYWLSCLSFFFFWSKAGPFGDSYLLPFLFPLILTGSIYLNDIFNLKSIPARRTLWLNGIGTCFIILLMTKIHWSLKDLFISKLLSLNSSYKLVLSSVLLFVILCLSILLFYGNIFRKLIITGILVGFTIQVSEEVIQIKGRHIMANRGKELSFDIKALKGKVLPQDAFLVGLDLGDSTAILYHTGYSLFYKDFDRLSITDILGKKSNAKTMARIINLSKRKPVICVYNHLYRYYLSGLGEELYGLIQEKHEDRLCFSNLNTNLKIYLLDNISTASFYDRFYRKGIDYYAAQLRNRPKDINLLNYLGWAYFCSGDFDQAIKKWREKEALVPEDADVHNNLGIAYYKKDDYEPAIVEYNKALELKPVDDPARVRWAKSMIYFNLAQAYEKADEKEMALKSWKNYYESIPYPENKTIMERHIRTLMGHGARINAGL